MANIYYVDPANGDNANDGLSTDKPIADLWSDNVDYGDKDDPSVFYLKRGTGLLMPADTDKNLTYGIVMSWPSSNDGEYWDNRPDDGTDWDDDDSSRANFAADNKTHIVIDDEHTVFFRNIDMKFPDRDTDCFINIKNGVINFADCAIECAKWPSSRDTSFVLFRASSNDTDMGNSVEFLNCNFSGTEVSVVGYYADDDIRSFTKTINIENSDLDIYRLLIADSDNNAEYGTTVLNINNSSIQSQVSTISKYGDRDSSDRAGTIRMHMKDTNIDSNGDFVYLGTGSYTLYYFNATINNCSIKADKYIFRNETGSDDIGNYLKLYISNSSLDSSENTVYGSRNMNSSHFTFNSTNNTFKNQSEIVYLNELYSCNEIIFTRNKYENISVIFKVDSTDYDAFSRIKMVEYDIEVDHIVVGKVTNSSFDFYGCKVNDYLFNNISTSIIGIYNSDVGAITCDTNTIVTAVNSTLNQSGKSPLTNGKVYIENCIINNDDYYLFDGATSLNATVVNSSISSDIANSNSFCAISKTYNTKISGETVSYRQEKRNVQIATASPYREKGSMFSLLVHKKRSGVFGVSVSEIFTEYDPDKTTLTMYFATGIDFDINADEIIVNCSYDDKDNGFTIGKCVISEDGDSNWDGLADDVKLYKAVVDISDANLDEGDKISFLFSLTIDSVSKYYLDAIIGKE